MIPRQEWINLHTPTAGELERVTQIALEAHTEWDSMHHLLGWCAVDGKLFPGVMVGIDPGIDPPQYPLILRESLTKAMGERLADNTDAPPLAALTLQIESYMISADATGFTAEQLAAADERRVHELADREEVCLVLTVDVAGRTWWMQKTRDVPDSVLSYSTVSNGLGTAGGFGRMMRSLTDLLPEFYLAASEFATPAMLRGKGRQ